MNAREIQAHLARFSGSATLRSSSTHRVAVMLPDGAHTYHFNCIHDSREFFAWVSSQPGVLEAVGTAIPSAPKYRERPT